MQRFRKQLSYLLFLAILTAFTPPIGSVWSHEGGGEHGHPSDPQNATATSLPRVLILGDSISMGYTPYVRSLLEGKAEVVRPDENCGPTTNGLAHLDQWLGDGHWDVIHFNFGLHDLKYVDERGERVAPENGKLQVPLPEYESNLRTLVARLRETNAKLIWCTTTPVPSGAFGRVADNAIQYNASAAKVMRVSLGEDRVINDLHAFVKAATEPIQKSADVHFTAEGSQQLARQVADAILSQINPSESPTEIARGFVYEDRNGNQVFDSGDSPLANVRVSNGETITTTGADGRYELNVTDDAAVFVIKPQGYRTPVDKNQLPQFYYLHKPKGSPDSRFAGVAPTGPLPESIDFPLYAQTEPTQFKALMFGDPQPRDQREVDYISHDVVEELIGTDASFGVTLGDITFDNLALFEPQARAIAVLGIPWYNVIGNHDMNYDATRDRDSDESFERVFGPNYYSFDYGTVHFLVLDDVEWLIDEQGQTRYQGGLGKRQMEFIRRDLAMIPQDQLVVLMMHIPLIDVRDRHELFRLIEKRPFAMSISAHAHTHEHHYLTDAEGWRGPAPHHHIINVTVCGSWWSGLPNERGIPHAMMADGAPNGYSILHFDGHEYRVEFRAAGRRADEQIAIHAPEVVNVAQMTEVEVFANVFNGALRDNVTIRVDRMDPQAMQYAQEKDPAFVNISTAEREMREGLIAQGIPEQKLWIALPNAATSTHLWKQILDLGQLSEGVHLLQVEADLGKGQRVHSKRLIRIERIPAPTELTSEGE